MGSATGVGVKMAEEVGRWKELSGKLLGGADSSAECAYEWEGGGGVSRLSPENSPHRREWALAEYKEYAE